MSKRFVFVTFGLGGKVHIRDNESKAHNHSLCGYNGFFSGGMLFSSQPTGKDKCKNEKLCKKCKKIYEKKYK